MIVLFLIVSETLFAQHTKTNDSITVSVKAFDLMIKDIEKYKLYKSAYDFQYISLKEYAKSSLDYFSKVQESEIKMHALQMELDNSIKALREKKSDWVLPTSLGVVGGLILGILK